MVKNKNRKPRWPTSLPQETQEAVEAAPSKHDEPLFLICYHRSGSTYTMRVLNACDKFAIYGEHEGVFNFLRDMSNRLYDRFGNMELKSISVGLESLKSDVSTTWIPYANPFSYSSFIRHTRGYVRGLFTEGLPADMRWGFKEIRYKTIDTIVFMSHLFPRAKFVFLNRETTDLLASNVRAPWVLNPKLKESGGRMSHLQLRQQVAKTMNGILEFKHTIEHCQKAFGSKAITVKYEDVKRDPEATVRRIMDFCGEDPSTLDVGRLQAAQAVEVGTEVKGQKPPMFDRDNLRRLAQSYSDAKENGDDDEWVTRKT